MQVDWVSMWYTAINPPVHVHGVHIYTLNMHGILQLGAYAPLESFGKWLSQD